MSKALAENTNDQGLNPYLSKRAVWALAVGTSVGWGSLVVTSNTYLSQAGPVGSIIGILIGAIVMLIVSRSFFYLADKYPSAGGVYTYTKNVFGYDRAFLISWFTSLTYAAMLWANATALPLFARYFFGDVFRFGYLYTIFGYEVYLGEAMLSIAAIALVAMLCIRSKMATAHVMTALVAVFSVGITVCFAGAVFGHGGSGMSFSPAFVPDSSSFSQIIRITLISPWAFIGFESVTHSSEEYSFKRSKLFRVLVAAVITTTLLYVFATLLSITAYPQEYSSWLEYIRDLGNIGGIKGLPAFYAAEHYLGSFGVYALGASLFALVMTSLIGNIRALSRLFFALAQDSILPPRYARLNKKSIPVKAILLIVALSVAIPFLGRTSIGWIVDITTIGATLIYGFVSAAAFKAAKKAGDRREKIFGAVGFILMVVFGAYLLISDLLTSGTLEPETYFLLILWSALGFVYFRVIISKDHARRFGKAMIVWIALLSLVVFMAMVWTSKIEKKATDDALVAMQEYYDGTADTEILAMDEDAYMEKVNDELDRTNMQTTVVVIVLFGLSLAIMLSNHFTMRKWEEKTAAERDSAREVAYKDPLTGVKSKHAYVEKESAVAKSIYDGTAEPFAVAVCDVNGLKHINDTLGHAAGDKYIRDASALVCTHFKHSPVYRTGGDEFVVIIEGADYDNRESVLAELNGIIEDNIGTDNVVISIGVSVYEPETDNTFHAVFQRADSLMYERKQQLKSMGARTRE